MYLLLESCYLNALGLKGTVGSRISSLEGLGGSLVERQARILVVQGRNIDFTCIVC